MFWHPQHLYWGNDAINDAINHAINHVITCVSSATFRGMNYVDTLTLDHNALEGAFDLCALKDLGHLKCTCKSGPSTRLV